MPIIKPPTSEKHKIANALWKKWRKVTVNHFDKNPQPSDKFIEAVAQARANGFTERDLGNAVCYAAFLPVGRDKRQDEQRLIGVLLDEESLKYIRSLSIVLSVENRTLNDHFGRDPHTHEPKAHSDYDSFIEGFTFGASDEQKMNFIKLSKALKVPIDLLPAIEHEFAWKLIDPTNEISLQDVIGYAKSVRDVTGFPGVLPSDIFRMIDKENLIGFDDAASITIADTYNEADIDNFYAGHHSNMYLIESDPWALRLQQEGYSQRDIGLFHISVGGGMDFWKEFVRLTDPYGSYRLDYKTAAEQLVEKFGRPGPDERTRPQKGQWD